MQNTKNATERAYQTQKILSDARLNKGVALSMQSLDPHTLKNIKRDNISLETYFELARRFTSDKVETYQRPHSRAAGRDLRNLPSTASTS